VSQTGQGQNQERKFIAVSFRGIQQASRERSALTIVGPAEIEVLAAPDAALPEPVELEEDAQPRPPLSAAGAVTFSLGGEAARAAYAYAAQHGLAALVATIGADAAGDLLLRWLADKGVGVAQVHRAGVTPVRALVAPAGYQAISIGGAADRHDSAAMAEPPAEGALLVAGYPYAGALRGEGVAALFRQARQRRVRTVLSLSPVALGGVGAPLSPADLELVLPQVDLICGSAAELRRATRRSDAQEAARALIGGGATEVLAKRGAAGAALFRMGPSALERADSSSPTAANALPAGLHPLRLAAAFGAVYDASYLLGLAFNDADPMRFAAAAAVRVAQSPVGVLGL
jgi:sugar/nucleoside kinase (ribokinase family)